MGRPAGMSDDVGTFLVGKPQSKQVEVVRLIATDLLVATKGTTRQIRDTK